MLFSADQKNGGSRKKYIGGLAPHYLGGNNS